MKKQQSGFTLIELIMVIVILGVLSAFAIPKFADLGADAEKAALDGARAAVKSASAIAHAKYLAQGSPDPAEITLEGETFTLINGYPALEDVDVMANISTRGTAGDSSTDDSTDYEVTDRNARVVRITKGDCYFDYREARGDTPAEVLAINGC